MAVAYLTIHATVPLLANQQNIFDSYRLDDRYKRTFPAILSDLQTVAAIVS